MSPRDRSELRAYRRGENHSFDLQYMAVRLEAFITQAFDLQSLYIEYQADMQRYDVLDHFFKNICKPAIRKLKVSDFDENLAQTVQKYIEGVSMIGCQQ